MEYSMHAYGFQVASLPYEAMTKDKNIDRLPAVTGHTGSDG